MFVFYFHRLSVLLLLQVLPLFPFVISILQSFPVPGDGHLTPGIRSQWMHGSPAKAALAALRLASRTVPSLVPVALFPKGNSHQRQWAAYQGKQQPPPCQPATKAHTEKGEEEVQIQYNAAETPAIIHKAKSDTSLSVL